MWKGFALFDPDGSARPAWAAFDRTDRFGKYLSQDLVLEIRDDELFRVPVEAARRAMSEKITTLRKQTGGVSVEHIALLSSTELVVDNYEVGLKSSLQNNMHLTLLPTASGLPLNLPAEALTLGIKTLVDDADAKQHRVVLICRGEVTASAERVAEHLRSQGFIVNLHPLPADAPLKFGMSGKFGTGSAENE